MDAQQRPTNLIQLCPLCWLLGVKLVQSVQPGELEHLLGEEESANELRHGAPEREVRIMDIHHVGRGEDAILLSCKVEEEACWRLTSQSA